MSDATSVTTDQSTEQLEVDAAKSTVETEDVSETPDAEPASGVAPLQAPEKKLDTPLDPSTCTTCKKPVNAENSVVLVRCPQKMPLARRCKACHTLKSRINRVMSKHGNLAEDWTKVTEEQKREFYKKYQESMGDDLVARLQETVTESKRVSSSVEFQGTGDYFDEEDMNDKYKNKPEQLANIIANTRTFFCPVRQVWLYEDVTSTSAQPKMARKSAALTRGNAREFPLSSAKMQTHQGLEAVRKRRCRAKPSPTCPS